MAGRLEGKTALIIGAGSVGPGWGNGRATAALFAREGAKVFGVDRSADALAETARSIGAGGFTSFVADVTRPDEVRALVEACQARFGRIDVLVNNVGGSAPGDPVSMSQEVWAAQLDHNLTCVFHSCKHVIRSWCGRAAAPSSTSPRSRRCAISAPTSRLMPQRRPG
jgi:NAD(P)-dependent dehydrogenase (short-subunit alcohol dehydrogenase family)